MQLFNALKIFHRQEIVMQLMEHEISGTQFNALNKDGEEYKKQFWTTAFNAKRGPEASGSQKRRLFLNMARPMKNSGPYLA